jgi:hypothetical protein
MDIEEFYDADDRRRKSAEIELGTDWRDESANRYELNWVEDTGELYVMREPAARAWADPFAGIHVDIRGKSPVTGEIVSVIAHIPSRAELEEVLEGWPEAMSQPDGTAWIARRLGQRGVAPAADPTPE